MENNNKKYYQFIWSEIVLYSSPDSKTSRQLAQQFSGQNILSDHIGVNVFGTKRNIFVFACVHCERIGIWQIVYVTKEIHLN